MTHGGWVSIGLLDIDGPGEPNDMEAMEKECRTRGGKPHAVIETFCSTDATNMNRQRITRVPRASRIDVAGNRVSGRND